MKSRVTFTLDPQISHRAKSVARRRNMSLSALVQSLLANEIGKESVEPPPAQRFGARWAGKFEVSEAQDPRTLRLKAKYDL